MARQYFLIVALLASALLLVSCEEELRRKPEGEPANQPDQQLDQPSEQQQPDQQQPQPDNQVPVIQPDGANKNDVAPVTPDLGQDDDTFLPFFPFFNPRPRPGDQKNRPPTLMDLLGGGLFESINNQNRRMRDEFRKLEQESIEGKSTMRFVRTDDQGRVRSYTRTCITTRDS